MSLHWAGSVSGKPCEKPEPVESAISSGFSHSLSHVSIAASRSVRAERHEMERLGRDRLRAEGLQDALAEVDVAATVAADVENQARRRQRAQDAHELVHRHVDQRVRSMCSSSGPNVASRT